MISSKYINKIIAVCILLAVLTCVWIVYAAHAYESSYVSEYQKRLFNGEVATIDIQVDGKEWQNLLDNATLKEYVTGDLVINGEKFSSVGIRTKGNSSLSQVRSDSGRYSLQFKMNHNVKGQTYYGLDAFCINNITGDATYMKDYIAYDIMDYIGVESPLTNYARVTVNGEDYGFCFLLERYEKAYLDRVYNTSAGYLYSVKVQMGQRDNFMNFGRVVEEEDSQTNQDNDSQGNRNNNNRANRGGMGGFGGSNGGSLLYAGDDLSSYSSIFDNAVFATKTTEEDMRRVVTAIQNLNEGTNLEEYWDVDQILRYLAAHTVTVNLDSYVSSMQQNYYIYEKDGKITILPWDYNLAFGGFQSGSASDIVNFPIDTPVSGVNMEDRPLISKLLEIPEYKEKYHEYLRQIAEGYFNSGLFESTVNDLDAKINEYVKNDVSAFFTHEQYEASLPEFVKLCMLRAESIIGQLHGTIPSTTETQRTDSSSLVNTSDVNLSALGSMMGGGMGEFNGQRGNAPANGQANGQGEWNRNRSDNMPDNSQNNQSAGAEPRNRQPPNGMPNMPDSGSPNGFNGQLPDMPGFDFPNENIDMEKIWAAMEIIASAENGELGDEQMNKLRELGFSDDEIKQYQEMSANMIPRGDAENIFPDLQNNAINNSIPEALSKTDLFIYTALFSALLLSVLFMMFYKRRKMSA